MATAYTRRPGDCSVVYEGGAVEIDHGEPSWVIAAELPGGPFCTISDRLPDGVDAVVEGSPPPPEGGWKVDDEVLVREICYAGPQWIYYLLRLVPGKRPGFRSW